MKSLAFRHMRVRWTQCGGTAVLAFCAVLVVSLGPQASAESEMPFLLAGAQSGTVTAVHGASFDINGKTFQLAPDAVIVDPQGQSLEADVIGVSAEVKYMVKRDQPNKIVKMVLYLPR